MSNQTAYIVVMTTFPSLDEAKQLAERLLNQKLAACINILPKMHSLYIWQGQVEQGEEHQLLIKTRAEHYLPVQQLVLANHPYELPEIIALPISQGLPAYLQWIESSTS